MDNNEVDQPTMKVSTRIIEVHLEPGDERDIPTVLASWLGARGGRIGGRARMATMDAEERVEFAKKGAAARWAKYHERRQRRGIEPTVAHLISEDEKLMERARAHGLLGGPGDTATGRKVPVE